jgi:hypothetical protein
MSEWDVVEDTDATPQTEPDGVQDDDALTTGSTPSEWDVTDQSPMEAA